ncbi:hypothetical protein DRP53_08275 [candidate division WOR-3 bacterium]|uniref:MPN domain-containing protein n=1 Tax=candidate division WOR-3 bacterium TaxID=2052148 RepID=A0A660SHC7_UNCW3|nr:MAG: hypothetical protein DRP53_08275 [candidate division WOR-3 bacterium]
MRIKDWPEEERPRERLIYHGAERLSNAELLAIIIGKGREGRSALDLAHELLNEFGGIEGLKGKSAAEISAVAGIGMAKAAAILAAIELSTRISSGTIRGRPLKDPKAVFKYFHLSLGTEKQEQFKVITLDTRMRAIREYTISKGLLDASLVHPREVFVPAIREHSAAILVVHNHPSGNCRPSPEDISITRRLVSAGEIIGIEIVDHVIVTKDSYYSFKEEGLL